MIEPYNVAAIQTRIRHVRKGPDQQKFIKENLYRSIALIDYVTVRFGAAKLVVLPEFWLTGADHARSVQDWTEVAPQVPGWETDALSAVCQEMKFYLAGATMEYDPTWPNRWFNCAFIIGPNGDIILKYRKHNCGNLSGVLNNTTPGDVYDEYVQRYGEEALFPVVETPIGRLACMVCFDINFGETARMLAMRGAEIICHPTGEPHGPHRPSWEMARRTRAYENGVYLISANHGEYIAPIDDEHFMDSPGWLFQERRRVEVAPTFRTPGGSEIVDYEGRVIGRAEGPGEAAITAEVNLNGLRQARHRISGVTQSAAQVYAPEYAQARACPLNLFLEQPMQDRREGPRAMRATIQDFVDRSIFQKPDGSTSPYSLAMIQTNIRVVRSAADRDAAVAENLERSLELAEEAIARDQARVLLMPEHWLSGVDLRWTAEDMAMVAIQIPGPETDRLANWAAKHGAYVAGATFECDPKWPGQLFVTAFIADDTGNIIHTYRKLRAGDLLIATPADVYSEFVDRYGDDALFPVTSTPYGKLATLIGDDVNPLEMSRILALKGAEVVLHPTSELRAANREVWAQARRTRAYENMVYWASANHGSTSNGRQPRFDSQGGSELVNFDGKVLGAADGPGEAIISATIDLELLRWHKTRPYFNFLMHLRTDLYAPSYRRLGATGSVVAPPELVPS